MALRSPAEKILLLLGKVESIPLYTHRLFGEPDGTRRAEATLNHPTAIAIRNLISSVDPEGTRLVTELAIVNAVSQSNYQMVGALIVELGLYRHLPRINAALALGKITQLALGIQYVVSIAADTVTDSAMDALYDWATAVFPQTASSRGVGAAAAREITRMVEALRDVERNRLQLALLGQTNPVIDSDRREVGTRLDALRADAQIFGLLDDADREARAGRFEDALHALRKFFEHVMILAVANNDPTTGVGQFKIRKDRAVSNHLITEDEGQVFQRLYNLLSVEAYRVRRRPDSLNQATLAWA